MNPVLKGVRDAGRTTRTISKGIFLTVLGPSIFCMVFTSPDNSKELSLNWLALNGALFGAGCALQISENSDKNRQPPAA